MLQININRFGVSAAGEMMKINSACEFGDMLDFDKIMQSTESYLLSQSDGVSSNAGGKQSIRNLYHLHAILCHSGSLNRGHYYSFIKVGRQS